MRAQTNIFTGTQQLVSVWAYASTFPQQGTADIPADNIWDIDTQFGYHTYNTGPVAFPGAIYVRPHADSPASDEDLSYNPEPFEAETKLAPNAFFRIVAENANTTFTPNNDCDWWNSGMMGLVHGIALDTITYLGDTVRVRKFAKWSLYRAALTDSVLAADTVVSVFVDSMKQTNLAVLDSIYSQLFYGIDDVKADRLVGLLNNITPQDSIESLYIEMIGHVAELFADPDTVPNGSAMAALESISVLCPLEHGPAIYSAREALAVADNRPRLFFNDCETLYPPQPPSQRLAEPDHDEDETSSILEVIIMPNPSGGDITITIKPWKEGSEYRFELLDPIGRPIMQRAITGDNSYLHLPFASGSYLYRLGDSKGVHQTHGRIIIIQN